MSKEKASFLPVDIWSMDVVSRLDFPDLGKTDILSQQELEQARRFRFAEDAGRFLFRRRALRRILSRYFFQPPEKLMFSTNENGKPRLSSCEKGEAPWEFNFSHSRDVAILALVRGMEVGIDLEYILKPMPDLYEVLGVVCCAAEVRQFLALPESWHQHAFFKLWTTKEAYLKALGTGLSREPDTVHLHIERGDGEVLMTLAGPEEGSWRFITFEPRQGYLATLALRTERMVEIRSFSYSGKCL